MRPGPLRDDQRPGLSAPSPPLKIFPAAPFCYRLGKLHTQHSLLRDARVSVASPILWFFHKFTFSISLLNASFLLD